MNKFRTTVPFSKFPFNISHKDHIMCIGSCFTEHIGAFLASSKFNVLINPFGIVYNPISICSTLKRILDRNLVDKSELNNNDQKYSHWDFHGDFTGSTMDNTLKKLNEAISSAHKFLGELDIIFITLGTANAFKHNNEKKIVANCHKYPNDEFIRISLSTELIQDELTAIIKKLQLLRPELKIIFTISPVRHVRDGIVENQLSKAKLIQVAHHLCKSLNQVFYFPSYELIMDDLRDYRFYEEDMIHINKVGLNYIWSYFQNSFFDLETAAINKELSKIQKDLAHKPFHPHSDGHQQFLNQLLIKINDLKAKYPNLKLDTEAEGIRSKILN